MRFMAARESQTDSFLPRREDMRTELYVCPEGADFGPRGICRMPQNSGTSFACSSRNGRGKCVRVEGGNKPWGRQRRCRLAARRGGRPRR